MKKLLFFILLASATLGLKAQTLTVPQLYKAPKNLYSDQLFKLDSTFKKQSVLPYLPLATVSTSKQKANPTQYLYAYDRMPVAKLESNDKMPVYNPGNNNLINLTKPTIQP